MVYYEDIGGEGGIRTHGARNRAQRFSKPSHSTALAPLRCSSVCNKETFLSRVIRRTLFAAGLFGVDCLTGGTDF